MRKNPGLLPLCALAACASAGGPFATPPPDIGSRIVAERGAVTSANPLASEAGLEMMRAGGNAIDAAVATAFAIGVVEPQMSGLGGSGAATIWLQADGRAEFVDFYAAQNADSYRAALAAGRLPEGRPVPGDLRIVGVPGGVAGLLGMHERFGRLPRDRVLAPAIRLAEDGFPVNQVLAQFILSDSAKLHRFDASAGLMWPSGRPLRPGDRLRNPALAVALRRVAEHGPAGFYRGETAAALVKALNAGGNPVTTEDFANYRVQWERPLCADYRGWVLLSAPPPQSGSQVLHTLELLEPFDLRASGLPTRSARAFDVLASALRVGMADNQANDDPNWVPVPAAGIISEAFARERATHVGAGSPAARIESGDASPFDREPPPATCVRHEPYGPTPAVAGGSPAPSGEAAPSPVRRDREISFAGAEPPDDASGETTHISVVDADGNAIALTQTNSTTFGSGASVAGFFLNDSGYFFTETSLRSPSRTPWRTRTTTIAPTIVLKDGRVHMVIGAPGGGRIPTAMLQTMVYTLDYGMDPLDAVRMPRMFPTPASPGVQLEVGYAADVLEAVKNMGWEPAALSAGYARLYVIVRGGNGWIAVADPRHSGEPRGY